MSSRSVRRGLSSLAFATIAAAACEQSTVILPPGGPTEVVPRASTTAPPPSPSPCGANFVLVTDGPNNEPEFCIMRREVTVIEYRSCVETGQCQPGPDVPGDSCSDSKGKYEAAGCLSYFDLKNYCASIGGRVPTLQEWERAATRSATPYGSQPDHHDVSRYLAECMAGCVREWTSEPVEPRMVDRWANAGDMNLKAGHPAYWVKGGTVFSKEWFDSLLKSSIATDGSTREAYIGGRCAESVVSK